MTHIDKKFDVIGFDEYGKTVIFNIKGNIRHIKATLPKHELVAFLKCDPSVVTKEFKDSILREATAGGRHQKLYSIDEREWKNWFAGAKYSKYQKIEE